MKDIDVTSNYTVAKRKKEKLSYTGFVFIRILSATTTVNREYFNIKIFSDSMACAKIKCTKYMRNINDNAVQGRLSENSTQKIIA